jgi:uncharacterized phage protein (TIGR01671 family)
MRELKFRFWDKSDKEWTTFIPKLEHASNKIFEFTGSKYQLENITIQQYTELKDAQGKEIYEGDIVEFEYWVGDFAWEFMDEKEVEWQESQLGKKFTGVIKRDVLSMNFILEVPMEIGTAQFSVVYAGGNKSTVIGNILETPELLK